MSRLIGPAIALVIAFGLLFGMGYLYILNEVFRLHWIGEYEISKGQSGVTIPIKRHPRPYFILKLMTPTGFSGSALETAYAELPVTVDVIKDGRTIHTEQLDSHWTRRHPLERSSGNYDFGFKLNLPREMDSNDALRLRLDETTITLERPIRVQLFYIH